MNLRIVIADEREARFFNASTMNAPLIPQGSLRNAAGNRKDRDLETDRSGRRFGDASGHRHGVDGEKSTERHDVELFLNAVAKRIDADRLRGAFEKVALIAPPKVLGLLRRSVSPETHALLAAEITKDLIHQDPETVLKAIPKEMFAKFQ